MAADTSLRFNFLLGRDTASPHMRKVAAQAVTMSSAIRNAAAIASSRFGLIGIAAALAVPHILALGHSIGVAAGAAALLPAAAAGVIGFAVAAKAAVGGLGQAWKATGAAATSGGGAAVDVAHRVEVANRSVRDATQALADAQRDALAAQEAVTKAREDASERLEDLSRSLRGARLDERDAVEALNEARQRLAQAKGGRNAAEIRQAQIAYERAALSLESVRDNVDDLTKEQSEAAAKGVEGSTEVTSAIERQEQAQRQLVQATERLADAQRDLAQAGKTGGGGGGDKAKQALAALAPSAAALVVTLRSMAPAWSAAAKGAQQATWTGVAGDMQALGSVYLPRVEGWLRRMGEGFNTAIRSTLGLARTNKFARDVGTSLEFIDQAVLRLAGSVKPVVNGIMQFVAVGAGFLPGIAGNVGSIAERFERWAIAARESGQMQQWIANGLASLSQFWALTKNVVMSVVALFRAGQNESTLASLVAITAAMRTWLESAEGQQRIAALMTDLRSLFTSVATLIGAVVAEAGGLADIFSVTVVVAGFLADHLTTFKALLPVLINLYIAWKVVQLANNAAMLASRAYTAATAAATWLHVAATNAAAASTARNVVAMVAMRVALIASAVVNGIATAAQWAHNAAWYGFPLTWIVAAILAVIAVIVLIIVYHKEIIAWIGKAWDWFTSKLIAFGRWLAQDFGPKLLGWLKWPWEMFLVGLNFIWEKTKNGVLSVHYWIVDKMTALIGFFVAMPGRMRAAVANLWTGLTESFRNAINWIIGKWNNFSLTLGGGTVLGMSIPSVTLNTPNLPMLDVGGHITATGLAVVHKGETVVPAAETTAFERRGGGSRDVVELRSDGSAWSDLIIETLRKAVRDRGGDVQFVLGK